MGIIDKLRKKENFTPAESALSDYILDHPDEAYRMSLQDLAKASYVSKPSVIRLYRKIGCSSYREFSIGMQLERIQSEHSDPIDDKQILNSSTSLYDLAEKIGILSKQVIDNCIYAIGKNSLDEIVGVINETDHVYIYVEDDVEMEVRSFCRQMTIIGMEPVMINDALNPDDLIGRISENDVLIVATSNRSTEENRKVLERLSELSAIKLLITTQNDPLAHSKADYIFFTYPDGNDMVRNNAYVSRTSLLFGLNILIICLYKIRNMKD